MKIQSQKKTPKILLCLIMKISQAKSYTYYVQFLIIMLHLDVLCLATTTTTTTTSLHPIILIPGSGGNQLEARLTANYKPSSLICRVYPGPLHKDEDGWYRIWFDASVLLAPYTKCFAERMMLYYDSNVDDYFNAPGVETRVPHFGSTQSLLYLDPNLKQISGYLAPLVKSLEEIGYKEGKTLFGAPYDFRYGLAPKGHPSKIGTKYLKDLKHLIEKASSSNGGKPVILISHSLGGLYAHQLLVRNAKSWREKFIKHFIALSTPWAGTVQEMLTFASGYTLGVPLVKPLLVRAEQRSSESNLWLMPCPRIFGHVTPLVITPYTNYTSHDIPKFLKDIGFPQGVHPYKTRVLPLVEKLRAPEVPITCIIGSGIDTPETLFYDYKGFDKQPSIKWGDGDGTVNLLSLLAVQSEWANEKNQSLEMINIKGVSHTDVLSHKKVLDQILRVISDIHSHGLKLDGSLGEQQTRIVSNM